MNIKTNILFFVKNTISKDYHYYNERHHEKPKQMYIWPKDYNFPVKEANSI